MASQKVLEDMFKTAGIKKEDLHDALRKMGKKYLKPEFKDGWSQELPTTGYCYVVHEAVFYYLAPDGTKPYIMKTKDGTTHWFLKYPSGKVVDLTADQFSYSLDYENAQQQNFQYTKNGISKRGKILADLLGLKYRFIKHL